MPRPCCAAGEDDEDSTLATDTAEARRSGRARRSGVKTAPATAPPATRSRAVRFFTAPAAAAAEEQVDLSLLPPCCRDKRMAALCKRRPS